MGIFCRLKMVNKIMIFFNNNMSCLAARYVFFIVASLNFLIIQNANAVGLLPVPEFNSFEVNATANFDATTNRFSYQYSFTNPESNTANVWHIKIDITQRSNSIWNYLGLTLPFGTKEIQFIDMYNSRKPFSLSPGVGIVPIGQIVPEGWVGGFGRDGTASFAAATDSPMIVPGSTKEGFILISPGLPVIRQIEIKPHWVVLVENHSDLSFKDREAADTISTNLNLITNTIGPSGNITQGSFEHWNLIRDNITKAIELNWIKDPSFVDVLLVKLQNARTAANNQDGRTKAILEEALLLLNGTTLVQRNQEIHDVIFHHLQSLIKYYTYDIPPQFEPKLTITPSTIKLPIGTLHTLKAKVINLADDNAPVAGFSLYFHIDSGPHKGLSQNGSTDTNGEYEFKYRGNKIGKDKVIVEPFFIPLP